MILMTTRGFTDEPVQVWEFEASEEGWKALVDCEVSWGNGQLLVSGTGGDPHFGTAAKAKAGWTKLTFRSDAAGSYDAQVFWTTEKSPQTSEAMSEHFSIRSGVRENTVYFKTEDELRSLRLDPHGGKCDLKIDWIKVSNQEPPPPPTPRATPANRVRSLAGFQVELLYSVPPESEGSWVSLTVDPQGRLITSDQYGDLYRITVPPMGSPNTAKVERISVDLGMAHGLLCAFDSLYVMVNGSAGRKSGLYRVQDRDGDDQYDSVEMLHAIEGSGEHGPHAVVLSPDGKSLFLCGGNHTPLPTVKTSRVPPVWQEDQLLPRMWDATGHAVGKLAPGGWVCRTDPAGKDLELISIGYRNQFDLAFNSDGELFTFAADMEWDVGTPWYRPTRVNHVTSGSEFGWRSGTGKWPAYYPDNLPEVVDVGPGSPTGIVFGTGAKFPSKYQQALFLCDWSYGIIYAVHMEPNGSSYIGTVEHFVTAAPLPVTDLVVNPSDGALYFTIGGRGTQSGLYRVTYVGDDSVETKKLPALEAELRRELETLHVPGAQDAVKKAWEHLGHPDRHVRYAARIAVEHQPVTTWQERVFVEKSTPALINASIALARHGDSSLQGKIIDQLGRLDWEQMNAVQRIDLLRTFGLIFSRMGEPSGRSRQQVLELLDRHYPGDNPRLNRELSQLLVYLNADEVIARTLELLALASTQEEQLHYVLCLRTLTEGWTIEQRRDYFSWFQQHGVNQQGGHSFGGFIRNIRSEAIELLSPKAKVVLGPLVEDAIEAEQVPLINRDFVKKWEVNDLAVALENQAEQGDARRGRSIFAQAQCFKCHRFAGQGGITGPDLTGASRRFNSQNILEALIQPSKVVSDQYANTSFLLDSGKVITGRIVNQGGGRIYVMTDMFKPGQPTVIQADEVEEVKASPTSLMPTGLLDTFTQQEILDLIAYLRAGGTQP